MRKPKGVSQAAALGEVTKMRSALMKGRDPRKAFFGRRQA